ncbi:MAG: Competence protein ComEA helix-hairpin-helix repeat protein [Desulfotomaculum sp. 46_296]|nr:MAG: Competence protein ComEA helix-hairpin-helix repeat protein [Desulfotomaculum sp. 46_296]HAU32555.1 competence protein ComEA [Desulfotomaculum sp.]
MFQLERRQQLVILIIAAVLLFGAGYKYACWQQSKAETNSNNTVVQSENEDKNSFPREIKVHVAGAVQKPGVYKLGADCRVSDAVSMAVALPAADINSLNLAAPVTDGQKITVPELRQAVPTGNSALFSAPAGSSQSTEKSNITQGGLININTADQTEIESLPGIGPALAGRIIQYREENGPYRVPEDIKNVSGIGEKRYEEMKDKITV